MKLDSDKYLGSSKVWLSLSLWAQACANESIICSMDLRMFTSTFLVLSEFPCWLELVSPLNNTDKPRFFHKPVAFIKAVSHTAHALGSYF